MNHSNSKLYVVVPTFKESHHVSKFLDSWVRTLGPDDRVVIVNANRSDETSDIIAEYQRNVCSNPEMIVEISGLAEELWSGTVNRGMRYVVDTANSEDLLFVTNIDVIQSDDSVNILRQEMLTNGLKQQLSPICSGNGIVLSSGTIFRSYFFALTFHPFLNQRSEDVTREGYSDVDYVTTRSLITAVRAVTDAGLVNADKLPHYGADNEWSIRLARAGYKARLIHKARVTVDRDVISGIKTKEYKNPINRLKLLFKSKSSFSLGVRWRFAQLVMPPYARISAGGIYMLKATAQIWTI